MNVAIEISGHLRNYEKGFQALNECLIQPNSHCSFYFFIHTWENLGWRTNHKKNRTEEHLGAIEKLLSPISFEIEQNVDWDTREFMPYLRNPRHVKKTTKGEHILGMFYSIARSSMSRIEYEKKQDFKFDAVIRYRLDIGFKDKVKIPDINSLSQNTILFPSSKRLLVQKKKIDGKTKNIVTSTDGLFSEGLLTDVCALSSPENMEIYASIFSNLSKIVPQSGFRLEAILNYWLKTNNIACSQELGDWSLIEDWEFIR